ncbi:MAG: hypothetical protein ABJE66_10215 [Deltaproteobacteria bacterium]
MVSLVTVRNTVLFGGAIAAGIAAFTIAYGRDGRDGRDGHDRGTPMRLPVLPKVPPAIEAHVTPRRVEAVPTPPIAPPNPPIAAVPVATNLQPATDQLDPELVKQIAALSAAARKRLDKTPFAAGATCDAVPGPEQKRITKLVRTWINTQHPDERLGESYAEGTEEEVSVGCAEPEGVLVTVAMDRADKKTKRSTVRRNYVLRIDGERVEVVADRTSTPSIDWMEWADEGSLGAVGTVDFDRDGKRDTIYVDQQHEGGAMHQHTAVMLRTADGTVTQLATITDLPDIELVNGKLVVGAIDDQHHQTYFRCLDKDRQITSCPEAAPVQRWFDKYNALARIDDHSAWNREQLAADFATAGIKGHAELIAAMPVLAPDARLRRDVEQFLIATNQYDPADERIERTHGEAGVFFDQLGRQLGDQKCSVTALTDDVKKAVTKWVERQAHQDMPPAIEPDCGNYVWTTFFKKDGQVEALLAVADAKVTKVITFAGEIYEGPGSQGFVHQGGFFMHGPTLVGLVFEGTTIHAIVDGKAIAKRTGQPHLLDYDTRWTLADQSFDLVADGAAVIHATATGLETIDPEPLRPHQIHRAALDRVLDLFTPVDQPYVAALRTLGAPAALVAEAKAQVAGAAAKSAP